MINLLKLLLDAERDLLRDEDLEDVDLRSLSFSLLFPFAELFRGGETDCEPLFDLDFCFVFVIDLECTRV